MTGTPWRVAVRRPVSRFFDDDLDRTLQYAAGREQGLGNLLEAVGADAHDDDFEAPLVVEVNVHRRADLIAQLVLKFRQVLAELPDVMVVNDGHAGKRFNASGSLRADDFRTGQVSKELRPGALALLNELVELRQERGFHRDTESGQRHAARR